MNTWIAVPCPGSRTDELVTLLDGLDWPAEYVMVLSTSADPIDPPDLLRSRATHITFPYDEVNIGAWWNAMLRYASDREGSAPHDVLCVTSDCTGTADGVHDLALTLREEDAVMLGPGWSRPLGDLEVQVLNDVPRSVYDRVPPECFMVRGELGLRCDVRMPWWYCEDDLEMQARQVGTVGLVGGIELHPPTRAATELTAEKQAQAVKSRALFVEKWGVEPW